MASVEFFFDYGSPWSYLANARLPALCEHTGCTVQYRPMLLGGVFKATGNASPAATRIAAKLRYGALDLQRSARHFGIAFAMNPHFPINTLTLMRLAHAGLAAGVFDRLHAALYPAFWAKSRNLGDADVVEAVLAGAGLDAGALLDAARQAPAKDALRATTDEAVARGVFGAPSFFVGDELFFGSDRLFLVEARLRGSS